MTLKEAMTTVRNGDPNWSRLVEAAGIICDAPDTSIEDLLECLKHRGLPSEFAAIQLYRRTKRSPGKLGLVVDRQDWSEYLRQHGFI
jgi:hypothetical protein